jgi:hypothetical protein
MSETSEESLVDLTDELALQVSDLVIRKSGFFSCGGSIPIVVAPEGEGPPASSSGIFAPSRRDDEQPHAKKVKLSSAASGAPSGDTKTTSKPVTVRWDPPSAPLGESRNACFPSSTADTGAGMARLEALLRDCEPATFGRGSEDVLDKSYRKASKLDASAFSTDFCPYALGIVNTAAELLMPGAGVGLSRAVEAELYKLNVSGSPGRTSSMLQTLTDARTTPRLRAISKRMWTRRARRSSSGRSSCVCHASTQAERLSCATPAVRSLMTGARRTTRRQRSTGLPSTRTTSMRCTR